MMDGLGTLNGESCQDSSFSESTGPMALFSQMMRLGRVLVQPGGLRSYLRWKPFSISSFTMLRDLRRQGLAFGTVIDGGGNVGQFARAAAETYPDAAVYSFEALPEAAETLRRNLSDLARVRVVHSALGSHDGTLEFFPNQYTLVSSALPLHPNHRKITPAARQLPSIRVPMVSASTRSWPTNRSPLPFCSSSTSRAMRSRP
jgi:FkbM family methyltransferase